LLLLLLLIIVTEDIACALLSLIISENIST